VPADFAMNESYAVSILAVSRSSNTQKSAASSTKMSLSPMHRPPNILIPKNKRVSAPRPTMQTE
jgi:hypothetical protein